MTELQNLILDDIQTFMAATLTSLDNTFYTGVILRLEELGYSVQEDDVWMLCFAIQKVENKINTDCNITTIPDEFTQNAIDMVCGEFLFMKQQTGKLGENFVVETGLKKVAVGDTTVEFGGSGNTQSVDVLIATLRNSGKGDLSCFRKLRW